MEEQHWVPWLRPVAPQYFTKNAVSVLVSGYFNPLHLGHLDMIREAKKLGDWLIVVINNDEQVKLKGSCPFFDQETRYKLVAALRDVDEVVMSFDNDETICRTLEIIKPTIFANGGDRVYGHPREIEICRRNNIKYVYGVGGGKTYHSSKAIEQAVEWHNKAKLKQLINRIEKS